MGDLSTATIPEILAELRRRRDAIDNALAQLGGTAYVIEQAVTEAFGVSRAQLHSPDRSARVALPRQAAMTLMREHGMTWQAAADYYGKDHGTALYAAKKIYDLETKDDRLAESMQHLRETVAATLQEPQI